MDKYTSDILPENSDFFIERFTYPSKVTMNTSHYHHHYEILYMVRGERDLIINNTKKYILGEDSIAIIPPNCIHRTKSHSAGEQTRICLTLSEKFVEQIKQFTSENILHCTSFYVIHLNPGIKKTVRDILSNLVIFNEEPFREDYQKIMSAHLFFTLSNFMFNEGDYHAAPISSNLSVKNRITEIIKYIQQHAFEDISLKSISDTFHISKTYLSRCFKNHTGTTVVTYINNIRIIKAQQLISEENISIATIAYTVGYSNRVYFERVFKKFVGISPKQYQMKIRKNKQHS